MALGMQPVVLTVFWLFALMACWLPSREKRILNIIQGIALALIAFAPFQFVIYSISAANLKFNSDRGSRFAEWLNTFRLDTYLYYFNEKRNFYLFALTGAFALISLIYRRKFFPRPIWILTFAIFMFPVVFDGFFHTYINWILNPWYRTCFLVTANIFLFALFTAPSNKKMRPVVGLASIAIAGLVIRNSNLKGNYGKDGSLRIDFSTMYQKISETLQSNDWSAYVVGECYTKTSSGWCFDAFIGAEILENRPGQLNLAYSRVREMVTAHDNGMVKDALSSSQTPRYTVAVIVDEDWKTEMIQKKIDARRNDIFIIPHARYVVVGLKRMSPPKDGINDLLITLTQIFSNDPDYMYPYELLARIAVLSGRRPEAKNWWKKILAMKGIEKLREDHPMIRQRLNDLEQFLSNGGESH
jgi:hypothetical protein